MIGSVLLVYNAPADSLPVLFTNAVNTNNSEHIYKLIHKLIEIAHENNYAEGNLWQNFLTHFILSNENVFSLACERKKLNESSLKFLALNDFALFMKLFHIHHDNMKIIENFIGIQEFYSPICEFSKLLASSKTPDEFYEYVTDFYRDYGVGIFAFNKAFRLSSSNNRLIPVQNKNVGDMKLNDIVGYEIQKGELISNTEAFISGKPANNVLLYGDGGTGKSGRVYAYYTCMGRRRKKCTKERAPKQWIEDLIIDALVKVANDDDMIDEFADRFMEWQEHKETHDELKILEDRLRRNTSAIRNVMAVIDSGLVTDSIRTHLMDLEAEKTDIEKGIAIQKTENPIIKRSEVVYFLKSFRDGDKSDIAWRIYIVETFLQAAYLYDDGRLILTLNYGGKKNKLTVQIAEKTVSSGASLCSNFAPLSPPNLPRVQMNARLFIQLYFFVNRYAYIYVSRRK